MAIRIGKLHVIVGTCDCEHGPRPQMPRGVRGKRLGEGMLICKRET